jgi:hypothetical protein
MKKLKVLYIDQIDKINLFLNSIKTKRRNDITIFVASNREEALLIAQYQKDIKITILTQHVYRDKKLISELKVRLNDDPEFVGVSSAPEIRNILGSNGCNLVFENRDEIIDHIPRKHP